ncbi:hypothetical protein OH460_08285 [Vibrio sp. Makdt]|uniref:hypothetical protein n=1 Tax=Vibrio sp. Makdt TaxID=2998828 RepID=UPI0022CD3A5C|nr:hypothetical protein [Vibrio sp. Makdt]MDA0152297.1 hypothetical protein [Vibrio sp. Makdt]
MITKLIKKKFNSVIALIVTMVISFISGVCFFAFIPGLFTDNYAWYALSITSLILYAYIKVDSYKLFARFERVQDWSDSRNAKSRLKALETKSGNNVKFGWSVLFIASVLSSIALLVFSPAFLLIDSNTGLSEEQLLYNELFNLSVKSGSILGGLIAVFFILFIVMSNPSVTTPSWMKTEV